MVLFKFFNRLVVLMFYVPIDYYFLSFISSYAYILAENVWLSGDWVKKVPFGWFLGLWYAFDLQNAP